MKSATKKKPAVALPAPPAENVTNDATRVITDAMLGIGESYAQGDLVFVRIGAMPKSARPRTDRQLAEGDTQGSRHICTVGQVYDADRAEVSRLILNATGGEVDIQPNYIGPVVVSDDFAGAVIEHPEHGDHRYEGPMVLATVFQRALDVEEREARVQD